MVVKKEVQEKVSKLEMEFTRTYSLKVDAIEESKSISITNLTEIYI